MECNLSNFSFAGTISDDLLAMNAFAASIDSWLPFELAPVWAGQG